MNRMGLISVFGLLGIQYNTIFDKMQIDYPHFFQKYCVIIRKEMIFLQASRITETFFISAFAGVSFPAGKIDLFSSWFRLVYCQQKDCAFSDAGCGINFPMMGIGDRFDQSQPQSVAL